MATTRDPKDSVEVPEKDDPAATRILEAALAEFTDYGIRRVSVDDIAGRAGMHRTTVYRYFSTKSEILQASAIKWLHDTFSVIHADIRALPADERLAEGFARGLGACHDSPLAARVLGPDSDAGLRALTTDGGPVIAMVSATFVHWLWDEAEGDDDAVATAEVLVRLALSFVLTPESRLDLRSHEGRTDFARRYLLPIMAVR